MAEITPPQWLIDRMEALKKQPPCTVEQALAQWKAGAKWTKEHAHCPKHKGYFGDTAPAEDNDCNHCWQAYVDRQQTPEAVRMLHEAMDRHGGLQC